MVANQSWIDGSSVDVDESADFIVIGSGAAGATCARWLAGAGHSVIVLEEGPSAQVTRGDGYELTTKLLRDGGGQTTRGADAIELIQGRCIGGSTTIGNAVHSPFPEREWRAWVQQDVRWAHRLPWDALAQVRDILDAEQAVVKTPPELWGPLGQAFLAGFPGQAAPTWRSAPNCQGSGRCMQVCPLGAKGSVDRTMLDTAVLAGARVYAQCRVDRVIVSAGKATGVVGTFSSGKKGTWMAKRAVFLALGTLQTVALLARQGLVVRGPGLQMHVQAWVAGLFPGVVDGVGGTSVAMETHAFRDEGLELQSIRLPKAMRARLVPGVGPALVDRLAVQNRVGSFSLSMRAKARGRVAATRDGSAVHYDLLPEDRKSLLRGVSLLSEAMLRGGALEVWPQVHGAPCAVTSHKQLHAIEQLSPDPGRMWLTATHFFGGVDVDDWFALPVFPTSCSQIRPYFRRVLACSLELRFRPWHR